MEYHMISRQGALANAAPQWGVPAIAANGSIFYIVGPAQRVIPD